MNTIPINRPVRRRTSPLTLACGCLVTFAVLFIIVVIAGFLLLPQIVSRVTGLQPDGQTSALFDVTPQPTPVLLNPTVPPQITVDLGSYGQQMLTTNNPNLYNFTVGTTPGGQPAAQVSFTEAGLMRLCQERATVCTDDSSDPHISNARIDLKPGGAVVYFDTTLPQLGNVPLPAGVVLRWDSPTRRVVVAGMDIGGTLYTSPPQSLADLVNSVEQQMNDLVQQVAVDSGDVHYAVSDVIVDDNSLTIILR